MLSRDRFSKRTTIMWSIALFRSAGVRASFSTQRLSVPVLLTLFTRVCGVKDFYIEQLLPDSGKNCIAHATVGFAKVLWTKVTSRLVSFD